MSNNNDDKDASQTTLGVRSSCRFEGLTNTSQCSDVNDKQECDKVIIPLKHRKSKSKKDGPDRKGEMQKESNNFELVKTTKKKEKRQLADMHMQKMPFITCNKNRMVAWTDLKEILFPSCSHPQCDIVVKVLKLKLSYPLYEDAIHPCSPKEHVAFLRKFRIVPSGLLLVDIDSLKPHLEELWDLVKIKHQKSSDEYSKQCHYSKAQTTGVDRKSENVCKKKATHQNKDVKVLMTDVETENGGKRDTLSDYTHKKETIDEPNIKDSPVCCQQTSSVDRSVDGMVKQPAAYMVDLESLSERAKKDSFKLPQSTPKLKSIDVSGSGKTETQMLPKSKMSKDAKKKMLPEEVKSPDICNVVLKKTTFPALVVEIEEASFSLFVPAYLLELCFPPLAKFLIQACRDHLVRGNMQNLTRCCSVTEGRAFTRWMCKVYGWAQNWRHITSRDILVRKSTVEYHLSNLDTSENYQVDNHKNYLTKNLFDIRDLSSVPKTLLSGNTASGYAGLSQVAGSFVGPNQVAENSKTPGKGLRQPNKRQRIKSPNEPTSSSIVSVNNIPVKMGDEKEHFSGNTNNSALTDDLPILERKPSRRFCANSDKKTDTISKMEVKAFGRLSRPESVHKFKDVKSKMITLEDKMKSQWEINKSKMKMLEDRILKKLEESKVSRERMISEHFSFKSDYPLQDKMSTPNSSIRSDNSIQDKMNTPNSSGNSSNKDKVVSTPSLGDQRHKSERSLSDRVQTQAQECKIGKNPKVNKAPSAMSSNSVLETKQQTPQTKPQPPPPPPPAPTSSSIVVGENNQGYGVNATMQRPFSVQDYHQLTSGVQNNPRQMMYNPNNMAETVTYQKFPPQHAQQTSSVYQYNQGWYQCNPSPQFYFQNQGFYPQTQNNVLPAFTSPPPQPPQLYPNSPYNVSNKNRLQHYYPQENYVTFQPVGNWPRNPPINKIKRTASSKQIENNSIQRTVQLREVENVSTSSKSQTTSLVPIPTAKESKSLDLNAQTNLKSEWNKQNNNKVSTKGKITLKNPPKLPNDLVGAIVEESKKSLARISNMSSTYVVPKLKSKKALDSPVGTVSKVQVPDSDQALLALVSSNPFTQSLESLKAMKDINSKQSETNGDAAATTSYSPFKSKHRCGPIQRSYGTLANSDDGSKNGSTTSTSVEDLIPSNGCSENMKINYIPKTNSNCKDVQRQVDIENDENEEIIYNAGEDTNYTDKRNGNKTKGKSKSSNKETDRHSVKNKDNKLADESKSEGCLSAKKKQHENTPVRQSSSAPSLWRKTASLFGKLHKDFGSYESIPGENLKMTFLKIKDLDSDSKKHNKDGKGKHKSSKNEASRKKEKSTEGKGRKNSYRNSEDDSIDLDDMQSILSAMQRSYKRHENTKVYRPKGNNSFSSYESAEKIYGANYTNLKAKLDGGNNVSVVKDRKSKSPNRKKGSNFSKAAQSSSDGDSSNGKGKPVHIPLPISMDRIQLQSRSERRRKDLEQIQKEEPKAYDECKNVVEKLNLLSYEGTDSILLDRRVDAKENLCCLNKTKQKKLETSQDSVEKDSHLENAAEMESPTSHPKKRWMKDFMVCGPPKMERIASMDLLAVEENIQPEKDITEEWSKDTCTFDISLNSKTDSPNPDERISPPVLTAASNVPNSDENSRSTSPPTLQLELVKGSDLTVDHEEEVLYESDSPTKFVSSTSISLCSQNDANAEMTSSCSSNNQLDRPYNQEERGFSNPKNDTSVHENCENEEDLYLDGSLYVVDDTKREGKVQVVRRSARQSISPLKNNSKKELDPISGKKINLRIPSSRGKKNRLSKSKNRRTPEKKKSNLKKNKNHFSNNEDQDPDISVSNEKTIWENVIKEQKIILDIIKRKAPKKEGTKNLSVKSAKSEESVDRGVPPCNTPCSLADDNDADRDIVKSPSKYGYGDGFIENSESFQRDREEFIDFAVKLEPKETELLPAHEDSSFKDYKASGDVDRFCDSVTAKKEEFMKPDAQGFLYEPIKSENGLSKGGLIYHDKIVIPYVMVNGYKYVTIVDILQLFTECSQKCAIPRNTLTKHRGLFRSYCNWEQMYVLDLLYVRRNRKLKTGDVLLRFDNFVKNLDELKSVVKEKHRSTTCKRSKDCKYSFN